MPWASFIVWGKRRQRALRCSDVSDFSTASRYIGGSLQLVSMPLGSFQIYPELTPNRGILDIVTSCYNPIRV